MHFSTTSPVQILSAAPEGTEERVTEAVSGLSAWWNAPDTQQNFVTRPFWILVIILVACLAQWGTHRLIRRATKQAIAKPNSNCLLYTSPSPRDS